jgi:hypothetical protein
MLVVERLKGNCAEPALSALTVVGARMGGPQLGRRYTSGKVWLIVFQCISLAVKSMIEPIARRNGMPIIVLSKTLGPRVTGNRIGAPVTALQ